MSPEVEKIGLARQTDEVLPPETADGSAEQTLSGEGPTGASRASAPQERPPRQTRRLHPLLLILLLLASAAMAVALGYQVERAAQLESRVAELGHELDRAHDDLAAYEQRMEGVRGAVADLTRRMSALQTLVDQPAGAPSQP